MQDSTKPYNYENLGDVLETLHDESLGITFVTGGTEDVFMSYRQLYNKALGILHNLQKLGLKPGDEMIFQLEDNQDFVQIFWACVLGGIRPVPLTLGMNEEHKQKLFKIWRVLGNPYLVASQKVLARLQQGGENDQIKQALEQIKHRIIVSDLIKDSDTPGIIYSSKPEDIAMIQFSSGSTGDPKGVILTHENLLTNTIAIMLQADATEQDVSLSWVPLTHDLGLIGFHITPMVRRIKQYIMPPTLFLTNPILWLEKAQQYNISLLSSPNFGYKHFLSYFKPEMAKNWDLSHIRLIFNGAEPISAELSNMFYNVMSNWGLRKTAAFPVYGLAEACLAVSFPPSTEELISVTIDRNQVTAGREIVELRDRPGTNAVTFVDLGYPVGDCRIRVIDDEGRLLPDNIVGNIQIMGKNITPGYYNNKEATEKAFTEDGWLKTGDLGFMRRGRLVVTGRAKDIIFVNGQNYYPHDIERIAGGAPGADISKLAVCGVFNEKRQRDEITVFVQTEAAPEDFSKLAVNIKKHVNRSTGLEVGNVVPVKEIPKTSSGKIQRYKLQEEFDKGTYAAALEELSKYIEDEAENREIAAPTNEIEEKLVAIWSEVLGINRLGIDESFFELGGDSLKATYIAAKVYREFNVELPISDVFQEPTIKSLAEYIAGADKKQYLPIPGIEEREYYPVSSAQKRMYVLSKLNGRDTSYNISQAMEIRGSLDRAAFEKACGELIRRHDSLRTSFEMIKGETVQRIHENVDFDICCMEAGEQSVDELIKAFIQPFELTAAPLARIGLIKAAEERHILVVDAHHIISDGTSMGILLEEFVRLYEGEKLPESRVQYKEYCIWQQQIAAGEAYSDIEEAVAQDIQRRKGRMLEQESYWLGEFQGELPVLNMPCDYQRPGYQSFEGDKLFFEIDNGLAARLKNTAAERGTSLYMILLAAYYVLLSKYSGQEDIIVGTPVAGRTHPDLEAMVGMFVNTLALRSNPAGDKSFEEFLREIREKTLKAFEAQDYQFDMLVEKLDIQRDMSRNPLFDTMFVLQNMKLGTESNKGLEFVPYQFKNNIAKFDLTLFAQETRSGIGFELEYCTRLFRQATIQSLAGHYINILSEIASKPRQRLRDIQLLSEAESRKLIYEYNRTETEYPRAKLVYQLFEEQAGLHPDNTAVIFGDKKVSYRELNISSNQLARKLREKGVKADSIVAIIAERSPELVTAILAVLKAGGAYLPIAPEYPQDRIDYMLGDSGANVLLTQAGLMGHTAFEGTVIDIMEEGLYSGDGTNLQCINTPRDLAYIIYTSGSTGKPKGVMIEHGGVTNYIWWAAKNYVKGEEHSFPLYTTISFDLTVTSIYTPLITGNSIVIYGEDEKELLIEKILREDQVGIIKLTPAHLKIIKERDNRGSRVKRFIVGGEQLETELARQIHRSFGGDIEIYNEYGPTETVVGCMIYRFDFEKDDRAAVPIGIPADNVQLYILDKYMKPVPENVPGEMYISGDGVARGYINRPELNAEKFVANPFIEGKPMYRTGDLAKWLPAYAGLPDGNMEFIGRIDEQVKIRGYRIEIGEIEAQLLKHESVKQAVVIVKEDQSGAKYLSAYIMAEKSMNVAELREHIGRELPEYMIPAQFTQLDTMPLTQNGKVDRKALKAINEIMDSGIEYVAAAGEVEERFAYIWAQVLGVEKVGILDNFFTLGGDSIKALQIASRLNQEGIDISVKDILTYQTISQICVSVDFSAKRETYDQGAAEGSVELTPIYSWFFAQKLANPSYYNQSVLLELKKDIDRSKLEKAFEILVRHHDALRLNYSRENAKLYFNNSHMERPFEIESYDISNIPESEQAEELRKTGEWVKSSFDIEKSLLIKAALLDTGSKGKNLLITAHHMVVDGISWRILLEDLANILTSLENGSEPVLPQKTASLARWQQKLEEYSQGKGLMDEVKYWEEADKVEFVLPADMEAQDWSIKHRDSVKGYLDKEETDKLLRDAHKTYNTEINDLLLTALARALREWSGREDMKVELESHGRHLDNVDVSRTVGWFTSIYPIKLELAEAETGSQIKSIKEQLRKLPNNGIGYGILKYMKEAGTTDQKNSEVRFNYLGQFEKEADNELFTNAEADTGSDSCRTNTMSAKLDINCMVINGEFQLEAGYNAMAWRAATIEDFVESFLKNLREIISHTMNEEDVYFTPSDFETVELNQDDLDSLFD